MRMYNLIMMMPIWKKEVLIQFGFGEINPIKVEQWIKLNSNHALTV